MHIALFAGRVEMDEAQIRATVEKAGASALCWTARERLLLELVDSLHDTHAVPDALWMRLKSEFSDEQLLELVMLTGLYGMVSMVVNTLQLAPEPFAARFTDPA